MAKDRFSLRNPNVGWQYLFLSIIVGILFVGTPTSVRAQSLEPAARYYGWLVLSAEGRAALRVDRDSLAELPHAVMDTMVVRQAARYALALGFDQTCSRFFSSGERIVVKLTARCYYPRMSIKDNGTALMAISLSGQVWSGVAFEPWWERLYPVYRQTNDAERAIGPVKTP